MARNPKDRADTFGLSLDTAVEEIKLLVEDAEDFTTSELEHDWETAERYYQGETDLEIVENRSNVVKTEVRDAIRNQMPSIMRILFHGGKIVNYAPSSVHHAPWVDQQAEYVQQLFIENDGYNQTRDAVLEASKLKIGPMKCWWESDPIPTFEKYTRVTRQVVDRLLNDELFEVEDYTVVDDEAETELYDVEGSRIRENGRICLEAIPNYEFFISRNVNSIEHALRHGIHGQKAVVTVSEAMEMGLKYDDWRSLDEEDEEQRGHTSSSIARRGYNKNDVNQPKTQDLLQFKFSLTEAYVMYDLKGTGQPQIYKFYLGGSSYKYIDHEEVEDSPFSLIIPNPIPHTVYGHSTADLTIKEQDTSTSILRATVDNSHAANNAKIAADPNKTNFDDLMSTAINAPIRKRAGDTLQVIQIPFTGQGNLGLLQYLDQDVQNKVGTTKAALGLDPDAMQSTDKNAVLNTIQTGQGQTELMVRNIIETGLIRLFRTLLRLSVQHMEPVRLLQTRGVVIPIDQAVLDPNAKATPAVGLGTASPMQKQASLQFIYQEQKQYMETLGPNNPFTSYSHMYNTLQDMLEAGGVHHTQRYFNIVTPDAEKAWAEAQRKQKAAMMEQAKQEKPMDPSVAFLKGEDIKASIKAMEIKANAAHRAATLQKDALTAASNTDVKRDELVQQRVIKLAEIGAQQENEKIKAEQAANNPSAGDTKNERGNTDTGTSSTAKDSGNKEASG